MDWLTQLSDARLHENIERLERDVQEFETRASQRKAILVRDRQFSMSDPLYQRLTSIRDHLRGQLRQARDELTRRPASRDNASRSMRGMLSSFLGARG